MSTLSQASLPIFKTGLGALAAILDKAETFASDRKIDPATLLAWRLAPDMFPLTRQIQIATDQAKNGPSRLAGIEPPRFEDNEASFAELKARLTRTLSHLDTLDPAAIDAAGDRDISFPLGPQKGTMTGRDYLHLFVLPNYFFHLTTAYAILRSCGVPLGKPDFLGTIPLTRS